MSHVRSSDPSLIPVGTYVRVSDGTPQPPLRFHRKHKAWQAKNYDGVLTAHRADLPGVCTVQKIGTIGHPIMRIFMNVDVSRVAAVPGMPTFRVNVNAFNPEVIGVEPRAPQPIVVPDEVMSDDAVPQSAEKETV